MQSAKILLTVSVVALLVSGCTPVSVAAGAGATVGIAAAQEGGLKAAVADSAIRLQITDLWMKHSIELYRKADMTVKEGRVLITGNVPTADLRVDAVRLAWQAEGVRQVINELQVDSGNGVVSYTKDAVITSSLKTKMIFDKYIQSINYTVESNGGTAYLMGIAQDQKELNRVLDIARTTKYVKNVVSYVRVRGETPAGVLPPTSGIPSARDTENNGDTSIGVPRPEPVESVEIN